MAFIGFSTSKKAYVVEIDNDLLASMNQNRRKMFEIFPDKKTAITWNTAKGIPNLLPGVFSCCGGGDAPMSVKKRVIAK